MKLVFKYLLALLFLGAGVNHFVRPEFYLPMMPGYLPAHLELIYVSGAAEILLGILLLVKRTSRLAAWGMIALMVAVFPANVEMAMHPEKFPDIPLVGLYIRLPLQAVLIWWAWVFTKEPSA